MKRTRLKKRDKKNHYITIIPFLVCWLMIGAYRAIKMAKQLISNILKSHIFVFRTPENIRNFTIPTKNQDFGFVNHHHWTPTIMDISIRTINQSEREYLRHILESFIPIKTIKILYKRNADHLASEE